jgi:hypothetical protein
MGDNDVDLDRLLSHVRTTITGMFDVPDGWPRTSSWRLST